MGRVIQFYNRSSVAATVARPHQKHPGKVIPFLAHHDQSAEIGYEEVLTSPASPLPDPWVDESTHAQSPGRIIFQISGSCMTPGHSD